MSENIHHDPEHVAVDSHETHESAHDGHGHGHEEHWGDYNSQPPAPSALPAISPVWLAALGLSLAMLLCTIVASSFMLSEVAEVQEPHTSHGLH